MSSRRESSLYVTSAWQISRSHVPGQTLKPASRASGERRQVQVAWANTWSSSKSSHSASIGRQEMGDSRTSGPSRWRIRRCDDLWGALLSSRPCTDVDGSADVDRLGFTIAKGRSRFEHDGCTSPSDDDDDAGDESLHLPDELSRFNATENYASDHLKNWR